MSEKIKIRKVSDYWGEHDCSSARNLPKTLQWLHQRLGIKRPVNGKDWMVVRISTNE